MAKNLDERIEQVEGVDFGRRRAMGFMLGGLAYILGGCKLEEKGLEERAEVKGQRKIAFVYTTDTPETVSRLGVMNADGSNKELYALMSDKLLWFDMDSISFRRQWFAWSPDGKRLAYESGTGENSEIYTMDADGTEQKNLTDNPSRDRLPSWSPDGKSIAFVSDRTGNYEVYVMNADGSNKKKITNNPLDDCYPAWSPDGSKIAFASVKYVPGKIEFFEKVNYSKIKIVDRDGRNERELVEIPGETLPQLRWSPDGKELAYLDLGGISAVDIEMAREKGTYKREIISRSSKFPKDIKLPEIWGVKAFCWSPEGRYIVFAVSAGEDKRILCVTTSDGVPIEKDSPIKRITEYSDFEDHFDWSPDGRRLAFSSQGNIYVSELGRGGGKPLATKDGGHYSCPLWQPVPGLDKKIEHNKKVKG